ncbi:hypothetical protein GCM10009839_24430 [Catenulispora yoronensis]|uniref:DUF2690 domain-containing protein n=1 Tax=Catenulispora yoronensis TaxID=450799 RepID=A0ABN2TZT6_9ACTN
MFSRRIVSRIGVGLGTVALASAPLVAYADCHTPSKPPPASCSNKGCNGKDPQTTGCSTTDQARSIRTTPIMSNGKQIGTVELRWSPFCGNNWARVTVAGGGTAHLTATATRHDGAKMTATGKGTVLWTPMIFGRDLCVAATGTINGVSATTPCA